MSTNAVGAAGLRRLRLASGLSQEQLAERCQVSERTIRSLESGTAKRPHRDTLLAVASALGLSGPESDAFVVAWRTATRSLQQMFHGRPPEDALHEAFAQQRRRIRELADLAWIDIGADGRWNTMTVRRTFEVITGELDTFLWLYSATPAMDVTRLDPIECVNVDPIDTVDDLDVGGGTAKAILGSLRQTLRPGDVYTLGYSVDFRAALLPGTATTVAETESLLSIVAPLQLHLLEIRFHPDAVPTRAWTVRKDTVDGPQVTTTALPISPFGVAHLALAPAPVGVHGISWDWDQPITPG